jgi:hypothetical protein
MRILALALLAFIFCQPTPSYSKTMLFGGEGHHQYLGCIDCSEMESDSICNGFGQYGNEFSTSGIFNEFAQFGNEFSASSPWNEFSTSNDVPVLVDQAGNFYGYFTINESRTNAVRFAPALHQLFKAYKGNLEQVRSALCRAMGKGS